MSERPPFDPSRVRVPASERPAAPATVTPRQVNEMVRGAISREIPATLHVLGEIGDLSQPQSGHVYLTLKDAQSELRCVMWRSSAARLKFDLQVGMEVIATGGLEVYTPRGTYQLIARKIEPRGIGALELAFRQLRERLEREGLFDPSRKKPIPAMPQRVALVTSPSGAAIRDILQTLARRYPAVEVLVFPVRVQGDGAAAEIAEAIRRINRSSNELGGIDVAIVGRGGGSLEDLWAFNEEVVARAIAASAIPIVSAVGHEVDISISDLVADLRAATPTAAAELITPRLIDLQEELDRHVQRGRRAMQQRLELARSELDRSVACGSIAQPLMGIRHRAQLVDESLRKVQLAGHERFRRVRERLAMCESCVHRFGSGAAFARQGERIAQQQLRLSRAFEQMRARSGRRLGATLERLQRSSPSVRLGRMDEHLQQVSQRTAGALVRAVAHRRQLLAVRLDAVIACDPKRILMRGYSITRDAKTRKVLRSIDQIRDRMRVITQLTDGEFRSTADDPRQPGLFD